MPMHRAILRQQNHYLLFASLVLFANVAHAQTQPAPAQAPEAKPRIEIYGFAMLDMGYDLNKNNPDWFDVVRPTQLPSFLGEYGDDGRFFSGVRQSRFGVKAYTPTDLGELRITYEYELFGTGVDAGQTTFRLRHAYGELGQFLAGQTWSTFMDIDVFPNTIEYWGPNGMVFYRNVQFTWKPIQGDNTRLAFSLERPGASGDAGRLSDRIELQNILARFPMPDIAGAYRWGGDWGYVRGAGIVRRINIDDVLSDPFDLEQTIWGWGVNLTSNIKPTDNDTIKLALAFGAGVENYMNDAPVDVGLELTPRVTKPSRQRRGAGSRGRRRVSRSHLERQVDVVWRAIRGSTSTTPTGSGLLPSAQATMRSPIFFTIR